MQAAENVAVLAALAFVFLLAVCFLVLAPLSIFKGTRQFAAGGFLFAAYGYGLVLWVSTLLVVYFAWGGFVTILVGLSGFGPIPCAVVIEIYSGHWLSLVDTALMIAACIGSQAAGAMLAK